MRRLLVSITVLASFLTWCGSAASAAPGEKEQSRWLLGGGLDRWPGADPDRHYAVGTAGRDARDQPVTVTFHGGASLRGVGADGKVHVGADRWFDGVRLPGPDGSELQLDAIKHDKAKAVTRYEIRHRVSATAPWTDPCVGGEARVLTGTFTRAGLHEATADRLTFACADGVAAKCIDWGYRPGSAPGTEAWRVHLACTRMGRGDYCADGTPHTRIGTYIKVYDSVGVAAKAPAVWPEVPAWPPPPKQYYFEAAWRADAPAICLSRLRWHSLPLGPQCRGALPDPRQDKLAKFCDHQTATALSAMGALIFNTSRYNDVKLDSWAHGQDRVATVRGFHAEPGTEFPPEQPFPGYTYSHGVAALLRSIPAGRSRADFVRATMFETRAGDRVLGLAKSPPPGYRPVKQAPNEGWLFVKPANDTVPLRMYVHPTTGDRVTDTVAPAGYEEEALLGYTLQSE